jgi:divalent metal cation (Fe/Co/Zn/Cd) transporter
MDAQMHSGTNAEVACCDSCSCSGSSAQPTLTAQIAWLQYVTIGWMLVECTLSLIAAAQAHSVALLAFGSDSLIELLSASVVLLQFLPRFPLKKTHAERGSAVLLYLLAGAVVVIALLSFRIPIETSRLGIGITAAALVAMPVLAWLKRRHARAVNDRALAADAVQSATCAYLAAMTLAGLLIYALWRVRWVDAAAALAAVPVVIIEGHRTWRGESCGCAS